MACATAELSHEKRLSLEESFNKALISEPVKRLFSRPNISIRSVSTNQPNQSPNQSFDNFFNFQRSPSPTISALSQNHIENKNLAIREEFKKITNNPQLSINIISNKKSLSNNSNNTNTRTNSNNKPKNIYNNSVTKEKNSSIKEHVLPSKYNGDSGIILMPLERKLKDCGHFERTCEDLVCDVHIESFEDENGSCPLIACTIDENEIDAHVEKHCDTKICDALNIDNDECHAASAELSKCDISGTCDVSGTDFETDDSRLQHKDCKQEPDYQLKTANAEEIIRWRMRLREVELKKQLEMKKRTDYFDPITGYNSALETIMNNKELIVYPVKRRRKPFKLKINTYNYIASTENDVQGGMILPAMNKELFYDRRISAINFNENLFDSTIHSPASKQIKLTDHMNGAIVNIAQNPVVSSKPKLKSKKDSNHLNLPSENQQTPIEENVEDCIPPFKIVPITNLNSEPSILHKNKGIPKYCIVPTMSHKKKSGNEDLKVRQGKIQSLKLKKLKSNKILPKILPRLLPGTKLVDYRPLKPSFLKNSRLKNLKVSSHILNNAIKKRSHKSKSKRKLLKGIRRYSCTHCLKKFTTKEYCQLHIAKHENRLEQFCKLCEYPVVNKSAMKKHMDSEHKVGEVRCEMCNSIQPSITDLIRHVTSPEISVNLKCPDCEEIFQTCNSIDIHLRKQHGYLICLLCNRQIANSKMKRHLSLEHSIRNSKIEMNFDKLCTEPTENDVLCEMDLQKMEANKCIEQKKETSIEINEQASKDDKISENKSNDENTHSETIIELTDTSNNELLLKRSSRRSFNSEKFQCNVCEMTFDNEKRYSIHLANNPKKFTPCLNCTKKFHRKAECKEHMKTCIKILCKEQEKASASSSKHSSDGKKKFSKLFENMCFAKENFHSVNKKNVKTITEKAFEDNLKKEKELSASESDNLDPSESYKNICKIIGIDGIDTANNFIDEPIQYQDSVALNNDEYDECTRKSNINVSDEMPNEILNYLGINRIVNKNKQLLDISSQSKCIEETAIDIDRTNPSDKATKVLCSLSTNKTRPFSKRKLDESEDRNVLNESSGVNKLDTAQERSPSKTKISSPHKKLKLLNTKRNKIIDEKKSESIELKNKTSCELNNSVNFDVFNKEILNLDNIQENSHKIFETKTNTEKIQVKKQSKSEENVEKENDCAINAEREEENNLKSNKFTILTKEDNSDNKIDVQSQIVNVNENKATNSAVQEGMNDEKLESLVDEVIPEVIRDNISKNLNFENSTIPGDDSSVATGRISDKIQNNPEEEQLSSLDSNEIVREKDKDLESNIYLDDLISPEDMEIVNTMEEDFSKDIFKIIGVDEIVGLSTTNTNDNDSTTEILEEGCNKTEKKQNINEDEKIHELETSDEELHKDLQAQICLENLTNAEIMEIISTVDVDCNKIEKEPQGSENHNFSDLQSSECIKEGVQLTKNKNEDQIDSIVQSFPENQDIQEKCLCNESYGYLKNVDPKISAEKMTNSINNNSESYIKSSKKVPDIFIKDNQNEELSSSAELHPNTAQNLQGGIHSENGIIDSVKNKKYEAACYKKDIQESIFDKKIDIKSNIIKKQSSGHTSKSIQEVDKNRKNSHNNSNNFEKQKLETEFISDDSHYSNETIQTDKLNNKLKIAESNEERNNLSKLEAVLEKSSNENKLVNKSITLSTSVELNQNRDQDLEVNNSEIVEKKQIVCTVEVEYNSNENKQNLCTDVSHYLNDLSDIENMEIVNIEELDYSILQSDQKLDTMDILVQNFKKSDNILKATVNSLEKENKTSTIVNLVEPKMQNDQNLSNMACEFLNQEMIENVSNANLGSKKESFIINGNVSNSSQIMSESNHDADNRKAHIKADFVEDKKTSIFPAVPNLKKNNSNKKLAENCSDKISEQKILKCFDTDIGINGLLGIQEIEGMLISDIVEEVVSANEKSDILNFKAQGNSCKNRSKSLINQECKNVEISNDEVVPAECMIKDDRGTQLNVNIVNQIEKSTEKCTNTKTYEVDEVVIDSIKKKSNLKNKVLVVLDKDLKTIKNKNKNITVNKVYVIKEKSKTVQNNALQTPETLDDDVCKILGISKTSQCQKKLNINSVKPVQSAICPDRDIREIICKAKIKTAQAAGISKDLSHRVFEDHSYFTIGNFV